MECGQQRLFPNRSKSKEPKPRSYVWVNIEKFAMIKLTHHQICSIIVKLVAKEVLKLFQSEISVQRMVLLLFSKQCAYFLAIFVKYKLSAEKLPK